MWEICQHRLFACLANRAGSLPPTMKVLAALYSATARNASTPGRGLRILGVPRKRLRFGRGRGPSYNRIPRLMQVCSRVYATIARLLVKKMSLACLEWRSFDADNPLAFAVRKRAFGGFGDCSHNYQVWMTRVPMRYQHVGRNLGALVKLLRLGRIMGTSINNHDYTKRLWALWRPHL
jgi:hypothetical protein